MHYQSKIFGKVFPDTKVHGANVGLIWGWQDPGGPHVGPMNFVIWVKSPLVLSSFFNTVSAGTTVLANTWDIDDLQIRTVLRRKFMIISWQVNALIIIGNLWVDSKVTDFLHKGSGMWNIVVFFVISLNSLNKTAELFMIWDTMALICNVKFGTNNV